MRSETKARSKTSDHSSEARKSFGRALAKARKERGFATAYAFFHKKGGKNEFGFSYKHYLMIEAGQRLPSRAGLAAILSCIASDDGEGHQVRRELLVDFLKALVDGDPLFEVVFEPKSGVRDLNLTPPDWRDEMLDEASAIQVAAIPRMLLHQSEAFHSSKECFWIVTLLLRSGRVWSIAQLAATLNLKAERLEAAVVELLRVKLIAKHESGGFIAPQAETDLWSGGLPNKMAEVARKKFDWLNEKVQKDDDFYLHPYIVLPVCESGRETRLSLLSELMRDAMRRAYLFNPRKPLEHGSLYLVQSRLVRLGVDF